MTHGKMMSMAFLLSTCLGGIAFAQGAAAPDTTAPPAQSPQAPAEQMQQPGATGIQQPGSAGMQQPAAAAAPGNQSQATNLTRDTIKAAQQQLKDQGLYKGAIDGRIGPATHAAVRQFQQQNGLKQTAMLDHETLQRLMSEQPHG
jgi:peptidoglycan hydrolase-like protein with peptidoglycan-binding domain